MQAQNYFLAQQDFRSQALYRESMDYVRVQSPGTFDLYLSLRHRYGHHEEVALALNKIILDMSAFRATYKDPWPQEILDTLPLFDDIEVISGRAGWLYRHITRPLEELESSIRGRLPAKVLIN